MPVEKPTSVLADDKILVLKVCPDCKAYYGWAPPELCRCGGEMLSLPVAVVPMKTRIEWAERSDRDDIRAKELLPEHY